MTSTADCTRRSLHANFPLRQALPPVISFIVPAHNEAQLLGATLSALHAAAATQPCEIIVVDDASTDATAQVAELGGAHVLRVEHRHIAAARNAGAGMARGDVLVFVDADTCIDADVLAAALAALRNGAVGGGATVRLQGRLALYERLSAHVAAWVLRLTRIAPGCFVFCRRAAFDAVGGFDETWYAAEDIAISRALARVGRFVILRQQVWTSERKLRTFPLAIHLRLLLRFARHGTRVLKSRRDLELWYGDRRDQPQASATGPRQRR